MKLVVSSDWHADHVTTGVRRFAEIERAAYASVERAIAERVDAYVFAGDLCDPDSGASVFRSVRLAIGVATKLFASDIPSIWVAGNHDVIEDGSGDTTLTPLRGLSEFGDVHVFERLGSIEIGESGARILALPYTATTAEVGPDALLRELALFETPCVVVSHLGVAGIDPGEETSEMPRGRDVSLPIGDIESQSARVITVVQGHYHARGDYFLREGRAERKGSGVPLHVVGSLARLTHGEEEHRTGYLILNIEGL